ncbi:MAG: UDP-N-acetylmuramate--L-alanine ligase [Armatimonadetes bacterium]|nr:UDP-N-acetylmuramate--L-alanine ligase [Armatimonadota bacterium]
MKKSSYHLVGVGGAGMSALARILLARGDTVSGSDAKESPVLGELQSRGAKVFVGHRAENLNGADCLVVSAAVPEANPEVKKAREREIPILTRAELLGRIMQAPRSVAVTGTHGKSTTSGMLSSLLLQAGMDPTILLGADLPQIGGNARAGDPDLVVAEVCEAYDSFLSVHPALALLTNVEADHLDYYGTLDRLMQSFRQFIGQVRPDGAVIGCGEDENVRALMAAYPGRTLTYGWDDSSDLYATGVQPGSGGIEYLLHTPEGEAHPVRLSVAGRHNVLNSMGAIAAAHCLGVSWEAAAKAVSAFRGTGRRLELVGEGGGIRVYDDYAHHPTEIRATLSAIRESMQPARIIAVFQPHLYSRTQQLLDDFAHAFEAADYVMIMEIYAAREQPIEGVTGMLLAERAEDVRPDATTEFVGAHERAVQRALTLAAPGDVIVCLGAGDITETAREIGARIGPVPGDSV